MEMWEHVEVQHTEDKFGNREVYVIAGPNYLPSSVLIDSAQQGNAALRHLDELGRQGWQLVGTEGSVSGQQSMRQFWLKRRVEPTQEPVDALDSIH